MLEEPDVDAMLSYFHSRFLAFFYFYFMEMPDIELNATRCQWLMERLDDEIVC